MPVQKYRVCLIGLGKMGSNHLRVLEAMPSVSEILCVDENIDELPLGAGKATFVTDLESALQEEPDYAVLATPSSTHAPLAQSIARSKVAALIEKPVANSELAEQLILDEFIASGTQAFAGFVERFNSVNLALKDLVDSGDLGSPLLVETERIGPNPLRIKDVGVILDLGSHDIDLSQWLFGLPLEIDSSPAPKFNSVKEQFTTVSLGGTLGGSLPWRGLVSWDSPIKSRKIRVLASEGLAIANALDGSLTILRSTGSSSEWESFRHQRGLYDAREERLLVSQKEPLLGQHEAIQDALAGGSSRPCTLEEAVRHMQPLWRSGS